MPFNNMKIAQPKNICITALAALLLMGGATSCGKKDSPAPNPTPVDPPVVTPPTTSFDINAITDTYPNLVSFENRYNWGPYNTHDPSILKVGDWYYCYSTDASYGNTLPGPGIMVRKSKDLVQWSYVGQALNGLPAQAVQYIRGMNAAPNTGIWAPYIMKVGNEYRLYYSLASTGFRVSAIGLLTASNPEGPWTERGLVVQSATDGPGTNAIDPTVTVTPSGEHWMVYGSAWDGLFEVKLDPATGLAASSGDKGSLVVRRGKTGNTYNGNLEGPEIIYNPTTQYYYLFVAYDWLSTKYNTRVYRSRNANGPFLDWNGVDVTTQSDHGPMIVAPYKFSGHAGWAGVSHPSVFTDGNGQFFIGHQGRPEVNRAYMVLHVRKLFWTADGWPVASPERYALEDNAAVAQADIAGSWEQIYLNYNVVPGYENEQLSPDYQSAVDLTLNADGSLNSGGGNTWSYTAPWLELRWSNGTTDKVYVQKGRDWENKKNTIVFTGLNNNGRAVWGKKK
ncbi:arabinan endo-1,5-alpha-L-arabinosidase [Cnuella takakiae]|uniref:Arabinan endo-1,5-alpha-L-arabinosidase n=1 Tax=Cnuella takakiae TaxID=1302690 RepID=A0A1M5AZN5_9BACT|nr:arabinan endo-1,5-alpha-L-arabinosidase [Cnuella takakiae]OLY93283.1 endo-arabinase [Cnuella takakiae]SHF35663.1 arabinan endo-1,5-alpha-L-arabinosidase [Cnuella takakiae]